MSTPDYQHLFSEYRFCAATHVAIDYSEKISVKAGNKAADHIRAIAISLQTIPGSAEIFADLLDDTQDKIPLWAAHHLLEVLHATEFLATKALRVIEDAANSDDLIASSEKLWLKS